MKSHVFHITCTLKTFTTQGFIISARYSNKYILKKRFSRPEKFVKPQQRRGPLKTIRLPLALWACPLAWTLLWCLSFYSWKKFSRLSIKSMQSTLSDKYFSQLPRFWTGVTGTTMTGPAFCHVPHSCPGVWEFRNGGKWHYINKLSFYHCCMPLPPLSKYF